MQNDLYDTIGQLAHSACYTLFERFNGALVLKNTFEPNKPKKRPPKWVAFSFIILLLVRLFETKREKR